MMVESTDSGRVKRIALPSGDRANPILCSSALCTRVLLPVAKSKNFTDGLFFVLESMKYIPFWSTAQVYQYPPAACSQTHVFSPPFHCTSLVSGDSTPIHYVHH